MTSAKASACSGLNDMANERHSHPADYRGGRTKGRKAGSLWYSETAGEGDVTFFEYFDSFDPFFRVEMLTDWIGMLGRELEVQRALMEKDMGELFDAPEAKQ